MTTILITMNELIECANCFHSCNECKLKTMKYNGESDVIEENTKAYVYNLEQNNERLKAENKELEIYSTKKYSEVMQLQKDKYKLEAENKELREKSESLLFLHGCEEEGMASGQPTARQWRDAVHNLRELLNNK